MVDDSTNWYGRPDRECGEHRPLGDHYSYCYDCSEKCSDTGPCARCELPYVVAEVDRLREGAEVLAVGWERESAAEFVVAAAELRQLINDPEPRQALAMAVVELRATVERCEALVKEWTETYGSPRQDPHPLTIRHAERLRATLNGGDDHE